MGKLTLVNKHCRFKAFNILKRVLTKISVFKSLKQAYV